MEENKCSLYKSKLARQQVSSIRDYGTLVFVNNWEEEEAVHWNSFSIGEGLWIQAWVWQLTCLCILMFSINNCTRERRTEILFQHNRKTLDWQDKSRHAAQKNQNNAVSTLHKYAEECTDNAEPQIYLNHHRIRDPQGRCQEQIKQISYEGFFKCQFYKSSSLAT